MTTRRPELLVSCRADVAEGPLYDPETDSLFWVDIPQGRLWRCDLKSGRAFSCEIGEPLGSIGLIEGGGFLLAARRGLLVLPAWGDRPQLWREIESEFDTQFNDGKCDRQGRFVVGTASPDRSCTGSLYRIDADGSVQPLISDVGMSNGLDWSPDDRYFYYVDTLAHTVFRYDWDAATGTPGVFVPLIRLRPEEGLPDGLTVDCEGCLWLAIWGASEVRRYSRDGERQDVISLPTPNVTSCTFGGPALSELYITTAAVAVPRAGEASRMAGHVFVIETDTRGQARTVFPRHHLPGNSA